MGAVLSAYIFLGRNLARSLGTSAPNQPTLESQGRRTLTYFSEDVRMATNIVTTLPPVPDTFSNRVILVLPSSSAVGTSQVLYYYNDSTASAYLHDDSPSNTINSFADSTSVELPAGTLTRVVLDATPRSALVLHRNLLSCSFSYYDISGNPYTIFNAATTGFSSLYGIKEIALSFTAQGGNRVNGTQTPVYSYASAPFIMRNRQPLP